MGRLERHPTRSSANHGTTARFTASPTDGRPRNLVSHRPVRAGGTPCGLAADHWQEWLDGRPHHQGTTAGCDAIQLNAGTAMGEATTMQGYYPALLGGGSHVYDFEANKWIVSSPSILNALNLYETIYIEEVWATALSTDAERARPSFEDFAQGKSPCWSKALPVARPAGAQHRRLRHGKPQRCRLVRQFPAIEPGAATTARISSPFRAVRATSSTRTPAHPQKPGRCSPSCLARTWLTSFRPSRRAFRARTDVAVTGDDTMSRIAPSAAADDHAPAAGRI